jgi:hypothetical protein
MDLIHIAPTKIQSTKGPKKKLNPKDHPKIAVKPTNIIVFALCHKIKIVIGRDLSKKEAATDNCDGFINPKLLL